MTDPHGIAPLGRHDAAGIPKSAATSTVGLLHTVPALAPTFDALIGEQAPRLRRVHVADAWLLATARRAGVTDEVRAAVGQHVRHLEDTGAGAVLVTCSSIGEAAEEAAATVRIPVVRVDAAMAQEAVRLAAGGSGRIAVLATLESTLGPTGRLVERSAAGRPVQVSATVVAGAAEKADAGDRAGADALVAAAVRQAAAQADVIVLAQASMAGAARAAGADVPVLTSPAGGVRALLAVVEPA
jgi:aspartate/glutamate racemase